MVHLGAIRTTNVDGKSELLNEIEGTFVALMRNQEEIAQFKKWKIAFYKTKGRDVLLQMDRKRQKFIKS